jgi:hypothetical protein
LKTTKKGETDEGNENGGMYQNILEMNKSNAFIVGNRKGFSEFLKYF